MQAGSYSHGARRAFNEPYYLILDNNGNVILELETQTFFSTSLFTLHPEKTYLEILTADKSKEALLRKAMVILLHVKKL